MKHSWITTLLLMFTSLSATAGSSEVIDADVSKRDDTYHFSVTIKHADTGWDHYANKWEIVGANGEVYGTRILHRPHVNEHPFSRSLAGVKIPANVHSVIIRSYDTVHGVGDKRFKIDLPK